MSFWCLRCVALCDEQWSHLKPASSASNIVTSKKPYQAQWNIFWVNEMDNLCNKSIFKKIQSDSDIVDQTGDIEHYGRSYKLQKMRNIGRPNVADQNQVTENP